MTPIDRSIPPDSPELSLHRPELLAPAGDWDCVKAAIENGADAVYFGLDRFNARMRAHNFTEADLPELMAFLHRRGLRGYVTLNTLIFTSELEDVEQYLRTIIAAGVDAAIVQDVGLCRLIRALSPDFPIHASTQMTITSAAGVAFAKTLGAQLVVLARECSLADIAKIRSRSMGAGLPLEVFVHGALCVAYSGQCLTSEALGGRSANRGECAQACRMTYDLVVDGVVQDLGDRRYLLSPQDLSGLTVLPELVRSGVTSLKIEGRLKAPEYVASVTKVYRQAIDRILDLGDAKSLDSGASSVDQSADQSADHYQLEMAFSRGLYSGWFRGINNQELVHGEYAKKRGVYLGQVIGLRDDREPLVILEPAENLAEAAAIKPGDGVVFAGDYAQSQELGGRVYRVQQQGRDLLLSFGRGLDLSRLRRGDRLYKTSDPDLEKQVRQTYAGEQIRVQQPIAIEAWGQLNEPLTLIARDGLGHIVQVSSAMPLAAADRQPLTTDRLQDQLGRLGNTPYRLGELRNEMATGLILPVSELNRLRRLIVEQLDGQRSTPKSWQIDVTASHRDLWPTLTKDSAPTIDSPPALITLVRSIEQLRAATEFGIPTLYCEFENPSTYRAAVAEFRSMQQPDQRIWLAPPRITKPGETYILDQVKRGEADGYLVRNYDHLTYFADSACIGDFSLNIANPIAAAYFKTQYPQLQRLTASYDLNPSQLVDLLRPAPHWFEVTIHQHMPMFHMEHCVFCAFMSEGSDFTNCGRPCESHSVTLRDRVGTEHVLRADAGCRNTLFNGVAQTGAEAVQRLLALGLRQFRLEFVDESPEQIGQILDRYSQLLRGEITGSQLWKTLKLTSQLGVTRGSH
jgi:U32 family peptidase